MLGPFPALNTDQRGQRTGINRRTEVLGLGEGGKVVLWVYKLFWTSVCFSYIQMEERGTRT